MPNIDVQPYKYSDSLVMNFRDKEEYNYILDKSPQYFYYISSEFLPNVWSVKKSGKIIAILGIIPSLYNFAEGFFFASEELDKEFDKEVYKTIKDLVKFVSERTSRIQTCCLSGESKEAKRNRKFLESLGFKQEFLLKKYGRNETDMFLYSIVK